MLAAAHNAKALVLAVKGEDLLFLDTPNRALTEQAGVAEGYARLGLTAGPFPSAAFHAPPRPGDASGVPHTDHRTQGIGAFWWTLAEFCADELLPYVFADSEDDRAQYVMVVANVAAVLQREATPVGPDGAVSIDGRTVRTFAGLVDLVVDKVTDEDDQVRAHWAGRAIGQGTVNAFVRRLRSAVKPMGPIVRGDLTDTPRRRIRTEEQVTVVDLHQLPQRAQRFVVGVVLAEQTARQEQVGRDAQLFVVVDELNRYAPREGSSPIKEVLVDIAERGRSLGICLIGAQQTASEVERRIIANASVKVAGRLDPAEAARAEYGWLPASARQRATLARPGAMFVAQPQIPVPLAVEFPFPAWATRPDEAAGPPPGSTVGYVNPGGDIFETLGAAAATDPAADAAPGDAAADDPPPF